MHTFLFYLGWEAFFTGTSSTRSSRSQIRTDSRILGEGSLKWKSSMLSLSLGYPPSSQRVLSKGANVTDFTDVFTWFELRLGLRSPFISIDIIPNRCQATSYGQKTKTCTTVLVKMHNIPFPSVNVDYDSWFHLSHAYTHFYKRHANQNLNFDNFS